MVQESQTRESQNQDKQRVRRIERILFIGVGSVFGVILIGLLIYNLILNCNICLVPGQATIMGKHVVSGDESDDYMLDYEFQTAGHKIRHSSGCTKSNWDRFKRGDSVNINYFAPFPQFASKLDFERLDLKQQENDTTDGAMSQ
jgi:hypothetical protein